MKRIIYIFICFIVFLTCSCTSNKNREDGYIDLQEVYKENIEEAMGYYEYVFPNYTNYGLKKSDSIFSKSVINIPKLNVKLEYESYIYIEYQGGKKVVAYEFESSELAKYNYEKYFGKYEKDLYSVKKNVVFFEMMGSYVLLNGSPIYRDGIYYDAKDKGIILDADSKVTQYEFKDIIKITAASFANTGLEEVNVINSLEYIGYRAFLQNENLSKIKLNEGLKFIGSRAFKQCPNLKDAVIPSTVTYIGENAFECDVLYCNVESKPAGWHKNFCSENTKVYWKGEWEYDKDGIPSPIKTENPDEMLNFN